MKKIFTLIFGLLATSQVMQAQVVQFRNNDEAVNNGETVTFYAEEDDWGVVSIETNPTDNSADLRLFNLTDKELKGNATITVVSNTLGTDERQWCMGGACVSVSGNTYDKDFSIPANGNIQVQYDIFPEQQGEMETELSVFAGLTTTKINIRFIYSDQAAVEGITSAEGQAVVARYALDGSMVSKGKKGFQIIRLADGRVIKQVVKE